MFVYITHPQAGRARVTERSLKHHEKHGWERADGPPEPEGSEPHRPQKNDSTAAWRTYAVARGMSPEQAADMGRDELVAHFDSTDTEEN